MPKKNPRRRWWMPVKGRIQTPQARIVALFGGVTKTAEALELTPSAVTQWKDKSILVSVLDPPENFPAVEI